MSAIAAIQAGATVHQVSRKRTMSGNSTDSRSQTPPLHRFGSCLGSVRFRERPLSRNDTSWLTMLAIVDIDKLHLAKLSRSVPGKI